LSWPVSAPAPDKHRAHRGVRTQADFLTVTRAAAAPVRRRGDSEARPCLLPDSIALADDNTALPDDRRHEPGLAATPFFVEFVEIDRLDPGRAEIPPAGSPVSVRPRQIRGPAGSVLIHLLALTVLLVPPIGPPVLPKPIPIQLVLEVPPPPPQVPPQMAAPPELHGRLASEDIGDTSAKTGQAPTGEVPETVAKPAPTPAPTPAPAPTLVPPPPQKPPPPKEQVAALADPKLAPPLVQRPTPVATPPAPRHPSEETHIAAHPGHIPGPAATRDEYLAYLVALTRRHFDLLPMSVLGSRTGETTLAVLVLADGTIARISVVQGSGYPDIDSRIEQMVAANRKFPPLPQWYQDQSMELIFKLRFPQALERR